MPAQALRAAPGQRWPSSPFPSPSSASPSPPQRSAAPHSCRPQAASHADRMALCRLFTQDVLTHGLGQADAALQWLGATQDGQSKEGNSIRAGAGAEHTPGDAAPSHHQGAGPSGAGAGAEGEVKSGGGVCSCVLGPGGVRRLLPGDEDSVRVLQRELTELVAACGEWLRWQRWRQRQQRRAWPGHGPRRRPQQHPRAMAMPLRALRHTPRRRPPSALTASQPSRQTTCGAALTRRRLPQHTPQPPESRRLPMPTARTQPTTAPAPMPPPRQLTAAHSLLLLHKHKAASAAAAAPFLLHY